MKALIIGVNGQDGSYLSELLLQKGYEVHGIRRWTSTPNTWRIEHILPKLTLHYADVLDLKSIGRVVSDIQPNEVYNFAGLSSVWVGEEEADYTIKVNGLGAVNVYEAVRVYCPGARIFQASSAEMYDYSTPPQSENTRFAPTNSYAIGKFVAHQMAEVYRNRHGLFISCGILFNHESPRRTEAFVSRKITAGVVRIKAGKQEKLDLWDMSAIRDWGFAGDYVKAMWLTLQDGHGFGGSFNIGSGVPHTVQDFVWEACWHAGVDPEKHIPKKETGKRRAIGPRLYAQADIQKADICLKWKPSVSFTELVRMMVDHDLQQQGN